MFSQVRSRQARGTILGLQARDKAAMLVVNTKKHFFVEFT